MPIIGTQQSPIKIEPAKTWYAKIDPSFFYPGYSGNPLRGHLASENFIFDEFETIKVAGEDWTLRRIHFHDGAEHYIDGRPQSDFEVHLVHTKGSSPGDDPDLLKEKLVIGAFFSIVKQLSAEAKQTYRSRESLKNLNAELGKVEQTDGRPVKHTYVSINPLDFLPEKTSWPFWFHYAGSLTSGSFSEDVSWFVYRDETHILDSEIDKLRERAEQEARPVQALNRRLVVRSYDH